MAVPFSGTLSTDTGTKLDGSTTVNASFNTGAVFLEHVNHYSVQMVVTSTLAGTVKLQASMDIGPKLQGGYDTANAVSNWNDITGATSSVSNGSPVIFNVSNVGYRWVRVVFTFSSGSGTVVMTFGGKG